jgi:hypothetical protein
VSSKKRSPISATSRLLELSTTLFLDHNLGNKQLPSLLRLAGFKIECHVPTFNEEEDDDVWIRECAKRGWVILTCDKNIEHDPVNRQAAIESSARIFFLQEGSVKALLWAAAIIVSKVRIFEIINLRKVLFSQIYTGMPCARCSNAGQQLAISNKSSPGRHQRALVLKLHQVLIIQPTSLPRC